VGNFRQSLGAYFPAPRIGFLRMSLGAVVTGERDKFLAATAGAIGTKISPAVGLVLVKEVL